MHAVSSDGLRFDKRFDAERPLLILIGAQELYGDLCYELERVETEDDEYHLVLAPFVYDLESFIGRMERLWEARS